MTPCSQQMASKSLVAIPDYTCYLNNHVNLYIIVSITPCVQLQLDDGGKATGHVPVDQLREAFEAAGLKLPNHKIRELQAKWRTDKSGNAVDEMDAAYFFEVCIL